MRKLVLFILLVDMCLVVNAQNFIYDLRSSQVELVDKKTGTKKVDIAETALAFDSEFILIIDVATKTELVFYVSTFSADNEKKTITYKSKTGAMVTFDKSKREVVYMTPAEMSSYMIYKFCELK